LPLHAERLFEVAQPVAASLDVQHVSLVQQAVENRGGEHLVAVQGVVLEAPQDIAPAPPLPLALPSRSALQEGLYARAEKPWYPRAIEVFPSVGRLRPWLGEVPGVVNKPGQFLSQFYLVQDCTQSQP
jgi:hypothetical protein